MCFIPVREDTTHGLCTIMPAVQRYLHKYMAEFSRKILLINMIKCYQVNWIKKTFRLLCYKTPSTHNLSTPPNLLDDNLPMVHLFLALTSKSLLLILNLFLMIYYRQYWENYAYLISLCNCPKVYKVYTIIVVLTL